MKLKLYLLSFMLNSIILFAETSEIHFPTSVLHESKNIVLLINPESGYIIDYSFGAYEYYGYESLIGINISQINTLEPLQIKEEMQKAKHEKRNYFHFKHKLNSGQIRDVYVTSYPMLRDNKTILLSFVTDVTEDLKRDVKLQLFKSIIIIFFFLTTLVTLFLLKKIKENEKRYQDLFENMTEAFVTYELIPNEKNIINYRCIKVNPYFEKLTGIKSVDIEGKSIPEILPNLESYVIETLDKVAKTGIPVNFNHYIKDRDSYYNYHAFSPSKNRFALVFSDITEQEKLRIQLKLEKEKAEEMATHDHLTKLPNRAYLREKIESSLALATRNNTNVALCMIDLDGFKIINDTYGHLVGDLVLQEIAKRTKESLRNFDTLSRFGGDEFVCLLTNFSGEEFCISIIERILKVNQEIIKIDDIEIQPSFSIGISYFPEDGSNYEELMKNADRALYEAKNNGKNRYCFYKKFCTDFDLLSE